MNFLYLILGAEEGVFINEIKSVDANIKYGDSIQIGDFRLEFFDSVPKPTDTSNINPENDSQKADSAGSCRERF